MALSVSVGLDQEQNLVVTGDDANNSVVIEERGAANTEKWVYVGGKLVAGGPFAATGGKVIVDLKGGNDSLTIRPAKGGSYVSATIRYDVDLGAGNDSFTFSPSVVTGGSLSFDRLTTGAGNDKVTLALGTLSSTTVGLAKGAFANLGAGDDQVALSWKSATNSTLAFGATGAALVGFDLGLGKDSFSVERGAVAGGVVNVSVDLGDYFTADDGQQGVEGINTAKIGGNVRTTDGATTAYAVYGGSNKDAVTFDDDRTDGVDVDHLTKTVTTFDLGAGDDTLTIKIDADRRASLGAADGDFTEWELDVDLGVGRDSFVTTFTAATWSLVGGSSFTAEIEGGDGDDRLAAASIRNTLALNGVFDFVVSGGEGNDAVAIALASVLRQGPGYFSVAMYGGDPGEPTGSGNDVLLATINFLAASTPDPVRQGAGVGSTGYLPSVTIVALGGDGNDLVGLNVTNASDGMTVHVDRDAGDELLDRVFERYLGDVQFLSTT